MELRDLNTSAKPTWCPGCGNFGILNAVKRALLSVNAEPHKTVIVGGVGCSGKSPYWIRTYGFHTLHGRAVPLATGVKIANTELTVICMVGDGDQYDEGTNHLVHAARRNIDITVIVHDNKVFGLTKGQTSPTSEKGYVSKISPRGSVELPVNPIALAIASNASFVARGFAGDMEHLAGIIAEAILHKGFSIVDVLQPCVSFNHVNTFDWYRERVYKLGPKYNPYDKAAAFEKAQEWGERIPIGVIYREDRPSYEELMPQLEQGPIINKPVSNIDVSELISRHY